MKKVLVVMLAMMMFCHQVLADALTPLRRVILLEVRESGFHSVYIGRPNGGDPRNYPNEGCDLIDRGVIDENTVGGKTLISVAETAYLDFRSIKLKVSGCATINGPNTMTAPKIVKIELH